MPGDDQAPVQPERLVDHRRLDEGVAVLVPADPGAEFEHAPYPWRSFVIERGQLILEIPVRFEGRGDERVFEEEQRTLYLLGHLRPPHPQLVRLPEDRALLGNVLLDPAPLPRGKRRRLEAGEHLADALVLAPNAPAHRLRRMRRERSEERRVGKECRSRWSPYH